MANVLSDDSKDDGEDAEANSDDSRVPVVGEMHSVRVQCAVCVYSVCVQCVRVQCECAIRVRSVQCAVCSSVKLLKEQIEVNHHYPSRYVTR